jgi:hypothetical protein
MSSQRISKSSQGAGNNSSNSTDKHISNPPSAITNVTSFPPTSDSPKLKSSKEIAGIERKETASRVSIFGRVALFSAFWMAAAVCLKFLLEPSLEGKVFDIFVQVLLCVLTLMILDVLLCCNSPARWFMLHAFGNFIIVYYSISDTVRRTSDMQTFDAHLMPLSHSAITTARLFLVWVFVIHQRIFRFSPS